METKRLHAGSREDWPQVQERAESAWEVSGRNQREAHPEEWDEWMYWWMLYTPDAMAMTPLEAEWVRHFWLGLWHKFVKFVQRLLQRSRKIPALSEDENPLSAAEMDENKLPYGVWRGPVIRWQGRKEA